MEPSEYRKLADVEDEMWYFRALHEHLWRELENSLGRSATILDAGCGTAGLIRRLGPRRPEWNWQGVDLSPIALALARERTVGSVGWHEASVTALPFPDAHFDAVVSADVLCNVENDAQALREFHRTLRPGGVVVLNLPAYRWLWSYHDDNVHSCRRYGRRELLAKLHAAGFREARATHWNTLPFPLIVARRKLWPAPKNGSDVSVYPRPVEAVFRAMMGWERAWLRTVGRLPYGSSLFVVARKPVG